jgi:probable addiction module antidote protein
VSKCIKVTDLPDFDPAPYLVNEVAITAFLNDILEANDAVLLATAQEDIARARGMIGQMSKTTGDLK